MLILQENVFIGAVIAASFFAVLFFTLDKRVFAISIVFFLTAIISFQLYFSIEVPNIIEVRITQKFGYNWLGEYKGRKLIISGKINKLEEGKKIKAYGKFDYNKQYSRGIIGKYNVLKYESLNKDFVSYFYSIKKNIHYSFQQQLGEEKSALIMALCYGDTGYLSQSQKEEFKKLGVYHAVSVSGFHMAIIYKILEMFLGLKISILVSFLYLIFTGIQAATLRAFIMILVFKFSKKLCKNYDPISSLSLAALIILLNKPFYAANIGFGLSFLATLGILIYYKRMVRVMYKLPVKLSESLGITLSSQVFTIPYTAFTIQNFSAGFILGNTLLLPMYSVLVILGNITLLMCSIKPVFILFSKALNLILTALEGANYLLLDLSPSTSYLGYFEGIAFVLVYFSFIMYKYGYEKYKYLPVFILFSFVLNSYSFVPFIYYTRFHGGEGVTVKYKNQSTMICNYDISSAKEVISLKDEMDIKRIVTNPDADTLVKIDRNFYIKVLEQNYKDKNVKQKVLGESNIFLKNYKNYKEISVIKSDYTSEAFKNNIPNNSLNKVGYINNNSGSLYVIMFNRMLKIK
ncbi:ComEC/Rec2 family competence protein [Clostridium sp. DJ247]|uniref:ComEC/Rec2 family competence protein n=1 Tax=Clostridium sp. DJ247 TaxID=2726188 RepID=UPI001626CD09|nr:ComEC/Rec2 family competence protein [Clostridium sp. DJ247]